MTTVLALLTALMPQAEEPVWPLPWNEGVTYEYEWHLATDSSRKPSTGPDGKTTFSFRWNGQRTGILGVAELTFKEEGSILNVRFYTVYDLALKPAIHISRVGIDARGKGVSGGGGGVVAAFGQKEISVKLGAEKSEKPRLIPLPSGPFRLYGHQAIQHWAAFLPFVDPNAPAEVTVFMPEILRFITIAFKPEGKEEIRGVAATRLSFTAESLFSGTVWLGPDRKLLRYQQRLQSGALDIWIQDPAKAD